LYKQFILGEITCQYLKRGGLELKQSEKEYLKNLIPDALPPWKAVYDNGVRRGKEIEVIPTKFLKEKGLKNGVELRLQRAGAGEITWRTIMGLASLKDQADGHLYLHSFGERTGVVIDELMVIPNILTGVPKNKRADLPKGTSFVLEDPEDWNLLAQICPIQPAFSDFHIGTANSVENTANAIKNGSSYTGVFAQFTWDYPGCNDDAEHMSGVLEALGMLAAKRDEKFVVDTYLDDGIPSYFLDMCSYLGYARLEKYIVSDLCGARYACSFGQLMDKVMPKMALWLALSEILKEEDQPGVSYIYSNCIDHWDHDLEANYGVLCNEVLLEVLIEKKYRTGISILPIPITEKVAVPTPEAIANIHAAARRVEEKSKEWETLMDFSEIEACKDILIEQGLKFFNNTIEGFSDAGIDVTNPLEVLIALKRITPAKLEKLFHPTTEGGMSEVKPFIPTSMAKRCLDEKEEILDTLISKEEFANLKGKRILVLSGDAHWYGMFVVSEVLAGLGVDVIDGGVGLDPIDALDLADESGVNTIAISVHNGQALDYAGQLVTLAEKRNTKYHFFMGGKLNGIVGDNQEPGDVTELVEKTSVNTCSTVEELVEKLSNV